MSDETDNTVEIDAETAVQDPAAEERSGSVADEPLDGSPEEAPMFDRRENGSNARHKRAIFSVPVQVVVSVGRASPSIGELLNMRRDALLQLDTKLDDPVDIMVGKRVIARGELQELEGEEGRLGVRLTEIVDLSEPF